MVQGYCPILPEYREFSVIMHDGVRLLDKNGELIIDPKPLILNGEVDEEEKPDYEDQGSRGFNYRNERFSNRVKKLEDVFKVFSSEVHGDPSTPLFLAYPGDPITIRLVSPADRARAHAFVIHGHKFLRSQNDMNSSIVSVKGQSTVGTNDDFKLLYGAGGKFNKPGDYMYRAGNIRWDIELGLWGIIRVLNLNKLKLAPLQSYKDKREVRKSQSKKRYRKVINRTKTECVHVKMQYHKDGPKK